MRKGELRGTVLEDDKVKVCRDRQSSALVPSNCTGSCPNSDPQASAVIAAAASSDEGIP